MSDIWKKAKTVRSSVTEKSRQVCHLPLSELVCILLMFLFMPVINCLHGFSLSCSKWRTPLQSDRAHYGSPEMMGAVFSENMDEDNFLPDDFIQRPRYILGRLATL